MSSEIEQKLEPRVQKKLAALKAKPVISDILNHLKENLPRGLYYHNYPHTEDVMHEVVLFALFDDLAERDIELLAVAAAYHDAGFLKWTAENESLGAKYAREGMTRCGGYTDEEIELVAQMILDTRIIFDDSGMRQVASTFLSGYLLDADLSNLGRGDFIERSELVRLELGAKREGFLKTTHKLIADQRWYTEAGRKLREAKKQQNVRELKGWLVKMEL